MLARGDGETYVFGNTCGGIYFLDSLISALYAVNREDGIELSRYDGKLSGRDEAGEILHLEIATRRGDVVASAMDHCHDRIIVRAE
jgi:hypothetical protein